MLNKIKEIVVRSLVKLHTDEEGASLVEYGLLVALIAVVCVTAVGLLGEQVAGAFEAITAALSGAV